MLDLIAMRAVAEEYKRELEVVLKNPDFIGVQREDVLEELLKRYTKIREQDLKHDNHQWLLRMQKLMLLDIARLKEAQVKARDLRADLKGSGVNLCELETSIAKLRHLKDLLKERWNMTPALDNDMIELRSEDGMFRLTLMRLEPDALESER